MLVGQHTHPQGQPQVVAVREEEPLRHDTDHGVPDSPDSDDSTYDIGVAAETRLPEVVPDDHYRWRTDYLVSGNECPAQ